MRQQNFQDNVTSGLIRSQDELLELVPQPRTMGSRERRATSVQREQPRDIEQQPEARRKTTSGKYGVQIASPGPPPESAKRGWTLW